MLVLWYPMILAGFVAGSAALAFIGARLYAVYREPQLRRSLKVLASGLGAEPKGPRFSVVHERLPFEIRLRPAAGGSACIEVSTNLDNVMRDPTDAPMGYRGHPSAKIPGRPTIRLFKKTGWSRLGERLRVVRGANTGDGVFDTTFWIDSDAPDEDVQRVFSEPRARTALLDLINAGAEKITVNDEGAALTASFPVQSEEAINVFTFLTAASGILSAAPFLPVFGVCPPERRRLPLVGSLWVLSLGALLATPLVIASTFYAWPLLSFWSSIPLSGFAAGFAAWTLLVLLIGRLLRSRVGARRHLAGVAVALLVSLPVHGAAAAFSLGMHAMPASIAQGYFEADSLKRAGSSWIWTPLEPVPRPSPTFFKDSPLVIQAASIARGASPAQTLEVYLRLSNESDEPRWFVVPWRADLAGISAGDPIHALGAHELRGRGRVVVVQLLREDGGGSQAFLVPARARISIERLVMTTQYPSLPRLIPMKAFIARRLVLGGMPLEDWIEGSSGSALSDNNAIAADTRQSGRARILNIRAGHDARPMMTIEGEESVGELFLKSPDDPGG